jgi:hypothetical protein
MRKVKLGHWADSRTGRAHAPAPIGRPSFEPADQTRTSGLRGLGKGHVNFAARFEGLKMQIGRTVEQIKNPARWRSKGGG